MNYSTTVGDICKDLREYDKFFSNAGDDGGDAPAYRNAEAYVRWLVARTPIVPENSGCLNAAKAIITRTFDNGQRIVYWRDDFWVWNEGWYILDENDLRRIVQKCLKIVGATPKKHNDTVYNIKAEAATSGAMNVPFWRDGGEVDTRRTIITANALINIATEEVSTNTPDLFAPGVTATKYDPDAPTPRRWLQFLDETFPGDTEAQETLQMIFGYILTQDTSQQKIFLLIGDKRSGKGTILRVMQDLVGRDSCSSAPLARLAQNFGLQGCIRKQLLAIGDARLGGNSGDKAIITERLLSISGEDAVEIDRKFKPAWSGRLSTRIVMATNEIPSLSDASGALASRFIILRFTECFLGREDMELDGKLRRELPGILNWAIEGAKKLRAHGRFTQPTSSQAFMDAMEERSSPIKLFVEEEC